jgi:hypothetical protein
MAAKVGWKGRMIAPAMMAAMACSTINSVRRLQCEGDQHTGSDRIHTAGDGEEPTIQFGTRLLIRLQQHPWRRRHQHHSGQEEKASEDGNHAEDNHP